MNTLKLYEPANPRLYAMLRQTCYDMIEQTPEAKDFQAQHVDHLEFLHGTIDATLYSEIQDLIWQVAVHYGEAMFDLGVTIGCDPSAILDLPDTDSPHSF
jgi:hypothetical protein